VEIKLNLLPKVLSRVLGSVYTTAVSSKFTNVIYQSQTKFWGTSNNGGRYRCMLHTLHHPFPKV